jgi:MoaA/NifB/PqqE/SkfB family radical SAM enzyme
MVKKIRLQGLSFKEELEGEKIDYENKIVYLSLVPWEFCNWNCKYCHQTDKEREEGELKLYEIKDILKQAKELNDNGSEQIKSLLLLGGEVIIPAMWSFTKAIIEEAHKSGLVTLIYTNGSNINEENAKWMADHNVSIALKLDTLDEKKYERLTGKKGSFKSTMNALKILKNTPIGEVVYENDKEKLVRLLFSTVGCSTNIDEYVSLARFATNYNARWMMESLNERGSFLDNPDLAIDPKNHSKAMKLAMMLNPEQHHNFSIPCRLFSCVTIRKKGQIGVCPQDYDYFGNIREISLKEACQKVKLRTKDFRDNWTGRCPVKSRYKCMEVEKCQLRK